jgi:hypothetical protein
MRHFVSFQQRGYAMPAIELFAAFHFRRDERRPRAISISPPILFSPAPSSAASQANTIFARRHCHALLRQPLSLARAVAIFDIFFFVPPG